MGAFFAVLVALQLVCLFVLFVDGCLCLFMVRFVLRVGVDAIGLLVGFWCCLFVV